MTSPLPQAPRRRGFLARGRFVSCFSIRGTAARAAAPFAAVAGGLALLAGCITPPKATVVVNELPFEQAVAAAADGLIAQASGAGRRAVVVDPMLDSGTGQQTAATQTLQSRVAERLGAQADRFEIVPFQRAGIERAQLLLTGTMTRVPSNRRDPVRRINLSLTDLGNGKVAAQAQALARAEGLAHQPLPYYADSPVVVKDVVVDGYIRTAAMAPGQPADKIYLDQLAVSPAIVDATAVYNAGRYADALAAYRAVLAQPGGEQLRSLNGVYLAVVKLGRNDEAEPAFGRVVARGIASNQLGVKFLFNPGATTFWNDSKVSGAYPMWLRQIARAGDAAGSCMNIVGHTSFTGAAEYNEDLSTKRAGVIRQRLGVEAPALAARSRTTGVGYRDNLVGSGTDDAVDILDRRVEFKMIPCL